MKNNNYVFRKALHEDNVSDIAKYIHLTDPYIYPTIASNPRDPDWVALISDATTKERTLFSLSNISVALHNGIIVGIACVIPCGTPIGLREMITVPERLKSRFDIAYEGYFLPLIAESINLEGYNITNICVDPQHRGKGVGDNLLKHCINEYGSSTLHLDVIADNLAAKNLYKKNGFEIIKSYNGFSGDGSPLPCYHMIRKPSNYKKALNFEKK